MSDEPMLHLIARSSLGGYAWCANCRHADVLHEPPGCLAVGFCGCKTLRRMTPEEYMAWKENDG